MYLGALTADIRLGDYNVLGANTVEIKESIHAAIWSCTLTLPNYVVVKQGNAKQREPLENYIKIGDPVAVAYGYNGQNDVEFEGYIRRINHTVPLTVECENVAFLFRKTAIKKVFNASLKSVLEELVKQVNGLHGASISISSGVPDMQVENFEAVDKSALWVIQELLDTYPMYAIYFKGNVLHCHMKYMIGTTVAAKYAIDKNTFDTTSLEYNDTPEEVRVILEVRRNNKVVTKEYGSNTAEKVIKKRLSGVFTDVALKDVADQEIIRTAHTGYKGTFKAFKIPEVNIPFIAHIMHPEFDRAGNYMIGTQTKVFDAGEGIYRLLEIDFKLPR